MQGVLHAAGLHEADGGEDHIHGAVARDGSGGVVKEGDALAGEGPADPGHVPASVRDQQGHVPIPVALADQLQHGLRAALRLLLPIRRSPQLDAGGRAGEGGLVLSKEMFLEMLQLGGPVIVLTAALQEEGAARVLGRLPELVIDADIRSKELPVLAVRVHAQRHGHGFAHLEQLFDEPDGLPAQNVDAVDIQVRPRQKGAGQSRPGPVPEIALRQISIPQKGFAFPVEEGDVLHLPPKLAPRKEGLGRAPQILGGGAALLAAGDDVVHPLHEPPAFSHSAKELPFVPVVQGGLLQDHAPPGPADDGQKVPLLPQDLLAEPGEGQNLDPQQSPQAAAQGLLRLEGILLRHDQRGPLPLPGMLDKPIVEAGALAAA